MWGPPGAGKTRVLASAIEELVAAGKRVLLVSTANVARDNALSAVVARMQPKRGVALRIGPPQLASIADNPDVQLHRLAAAASAEVDGQRGVVEAELAEIAQLDDAIDELQSRVGGFTPSEFRAASGRVANERRLAELLAQQSAIEENILEARARVITRRIACMAAEEAVALVSPARAALVAVDQLVNQRSENGAKLLKKRTDMRAAETKLDGASGWWAKRKARRERDDAAEDLAAFEPLQSATADIGRQIEAQMLIIGTQTLESIAELDTALDLANRQSNDASAEVALADNDWTH